MLLLQRLILHGSISAAVRIAQLMKLHKLGNDPNKMPLDDPAWPSQLSSYSARLIEALTDRLFVRKQGLWS